MPVSSTTNVKGAEDCLNRSKATAACFVHLETFLAHRCRRKKGALAVKFMNKSLLKTGVIGAIIAALCCFTPILVILFGALGLSALVGYLDYVLFPMLGLFLIIIGVAIVRNRGSAQ